MTPASAPIGRGTRVAIVWNYPSQLRHCSFRFEQYVKGFRSLGHEPMIVCSADAAEGFTAPLHTCEDRARFTDPAFWREVGAELAVIVTWHRMAEVLAAMGEAGTRAIALSDTDGQVSDHVFPRATLRQTWFRKSSKTDQLRALAGWLRNYMAAFWTETTLDEETLQSTRLSDVLVFGHREGKRHFETFLKRLRAEELSSRLTVAPFTIGQAYIDCPVPAEKEDFIVAIGRWGDPQKNASQLAAALATFLARRPQTKIEIFGVDGAPFFSDLVERYSTVSYRGTGGPDVLALSLARARSIVFASHWEGCPHAGLEALAMGATVVGTPIPALISWSEGERFGRVSRGRQSGGLARALEYEMQSWDDGHRNCQAIAATWRQRLEPREVCRQMLAALP
jgi:glycosyltransferase involved in cell wall biosynthesis